MKVRVSYTTEVSDEYRAAINHHYGLPGLASREDVKRWLREYGSSADDDIMWDYQQAQERREQEIAEVIEAAAEAHREGR